MSDNPSFQNIVIPLGQHWQAIVLPTQEVILQCHNQALSPNGYIKSLFEIGLESEEMARKAWIRTVQCMPSGAIWSDPHAISPSGILSPSKYEMIPSVMESARILTQIESWTHNPIER